MTAPLFENSVEANGVAPFASHVPTLRFALMVAVAVLPLYASQTLIPALNASLHLGSAITLVTALTLLGYAVGLVLLVPLVDRWPNRALIAGTLSAQVVCLAVAAAAPSAALFLCASFAVGVSASAVQMLVPAAASLAPPQARGKVVGNVMSGLMLGILLSRPLASIVGGAFGWRGFFAADAVLVAAATLLVVPRLPDIRPSGAPSYAALIASMGRLIATEPVLRQRALYQGLLMAGFNAFWSSVAVVLTRTPLNLDTTHIALFALAGGGSVIVAPLAGRLGDRGHTTRTTAVAHCITLVATVCAACALGGMPRGVSIGLLVVAACAIDGGVIADQALGRRAINLLAPQSRGRVNGLYTGLFFIGSACGAAIAGPALARWGWPGVCTATFIFFAAAALLHIVDRLRANAPGR
ncbi:MFS transporter [Paraburkholderia phenazinium]|uniref:Predicted arabinose efflux permease, MFS family n=1 Tax=Paraburkholderia phenazinium TaxID=60549 RepID=A0A1G8FB84_9BURK|nr:MFS transporter [Paraburkholderia phenazinium]SDH79411.1 Predicted arabinose efflux permease, MFS family [Paraburkholderia phenazinium]